MGQYWKVVNLDKKEFLDPHALGCGLKLWEQLAGHPGTGAALIILCAAMPEARGGGDFDLDRNWHGPERRITEQLTGSGVIPGPMPTEYRAIAKRTIGRWAGDRIALIGDYAEAEDLAAEHRADLIYSLCRSQEDRADTIEHLRNLALGAGKRTKRAKEYLAKSKALESSVLWRDITADVCAVIEHELDGKFSGEGWREFKSNVAQMSVA